MRPRLGRASPWPSVSRGRGKAGAAFVRGAVHLDQSALLGPLAKGRSWACAEERAKQVGVEGWAFRAKRERERVFISFIFSFISKLFSKSFSKSNLNHFVFWSKPHITKTQMHQHVCINMLLP